MTALWELEKHFIASFISSECDLLFIFSDNNMCYEKEMKVNTC
jgi:hypothetical protein